MLPLILRRPSPTGPGPATDVVEQAERKGALAVLVVNFTPSPVARTAEVNVFRGGDPGHHRPRRRRDRHAGLVKLLGTSKQEIKPQVRRWTFADGDLIIVLSEGRLMNVGNATGHTSFVVSNLFSIQTIAQIELFNNTDEYVDEEGKPTEQTLPKHLDEKSRSWILTRPGSSSSSSPRSRPSTSASTSPGRTSRSTTATEVAAPGALSA